MDMDRRQFVTGATGLSILGLAGCATSEPGAAGLKEADSRQAAFFYAFPLYEFARTAQQRTGGNAGAAGAALNKVAHRAALADHTSRQVTAPNNDTIYSSAFLELSGGPVEVTAPTETKRYYSIAFMDAFTDNFAYIGTRATKGIGGKFWVVGPQWAGKAPGDVTVFRSSTNDVWMLGRTLVDGAADMAAARAVQQQITVRPVTDAPAKPYGVRCTNVEDPANFLGVVNDILARSPGDKGQTARASKFAGHGIGAGVNASPEELAAWKTYIPLGIDKLRDKFMFRDLVINGWGYQEKGVGDFGTNDYLRAGIALGGLAALGEEEAMYLQATTDGKGEKLNGQNKYRWRIPPGGVPASAFWSLTMYQAEADGRYFLAQNPINRFSIGDRTPGLVKNADGSIDILIQRDAPEGALAANWLPAAAGDMRMSLRAYLPKKELRDRSWKCPPVEKL
jgi:hypothetical protein